MDDVQADPAAALREILSGEAQDSLREGDLPRELELMQPVAMDREDPGPDWIFEPLLDGMRCLALRRGDSVRLLADGTRPLSTRIPRVERALLEAGPESFALDGVLLDVDPQFEQGMLLSGAERSAGGTDGRGLEPRLIAFDLLHVQGYDLSGLALVERRRVLRSLFRFSPVFLYARESVAPARVVFDKAERERWRGVVAKRRDGTYDPESEAWRVWRLRSSEAEGDAASAEADADR